MKPYLMVLAAFVFLTSLLLVPDVYAQFGGGMGGSGGMGGARRGERTKGCETGEKPDSGKAAMGRPPEIMGRDQLEYRLNTLQVDLHLTPAQAVLWMPFADRVMALEADLARQRGRGVSASATQPTTAPGNGVKQIATAVDTARNRLAALEDIEAASRALYQALQDDQKTMADLRMAEFMLPLLRA